MGTDRWVDVDLRTSSLARHAQAKILPEPRKVREVAMCELVGL